MDIKRKLENLVNALDSEAESHNAHDFVITHRALAVLMVEVIGVELTLEVFQAIKRESKGDGLPGLTGVAGTGPDVEFLARRGLSTDWGKWKLP